MSLFSLDIAEILSSPIGTMREFQFAQDLPTNTFSEVICEKNLIMDIKLIRQDYGIECLFLSLETTINIPSESIENKDIILKNQSREFHVKKHETDTDDIQYIDTHTMMIDLTQVIEEELLIAGL